MEAVEERLHTFLNPTPHKFERSTAHRMYSAGVQFHTFVTSSPDIVNGSSQHRMDAVDV